MGECAPNSQFSTVAVEMNIVAQEKVDKARVVQSRIFKKTNIRMSTADILIEMGAITPSQRDTILGVLNEIESQTEIQPTTPDAHQKKKPKSPAKNTDNTLDISVSRNKLTVSVLYYGEFPATDLDINKVKTMLHAEGIVHGIADDEKIRDFLNADFCVGEPWTIATGTAPTPDAPGEIVYHFDKDPMKIGTVTEDGLMDWKDRGALPQVKAGDLLAEIIPGPTGKEGMDVYGKKIPTPKSDETRLRLKCGNGTRRSEDRMQAFAEASGIPKISMTGVISVVSTLTINGDVSLETGHVTFNGHIEVTGTIEKGYRVKGQSLRANEIRSAEIDIDEDIIAINGIFGAAIRCGGNLKAGHINNTTIVAGGDIAVKKEIIDSIIEANGRCLINDGTILSSTIFAKMGITTMDVGTKAASPSKLTVGINQPLEREMASTKDQIQTTKSTCENLPTQLKDLEAQSDRVNTRLGEVAQEQDRCMVQHRLLQEKVEAGLLEKEGPEAEKLQKTIADLKVKQDAYDADVANLMEEDEAIGQQIAALKKKVVENAEALEKLKTHLDHLTEQKKTDKGLAVVKVGGVIFPGNTIIGPHSKIVIKEGLKRLSIAETNKPDQSGAKKWRFALAPYH